jgi:hypothetical protein
MRGYVQLIFIKTLNIDIDFNAFKKNYPYDDASFSRGRNEKKINGEQEG